MGYKKFLPVDMALRACFPTARSPTARLLRCPGKSNLSSVCLLICRVFGLAGKHDRPTDLDMLTFEQI